MSLSLLLGEKRKQNFAKWQMKLQEGITGILNQKKGLTEAENDPIKRFEVKSKKSPQPYDDVEGFEFADIGEFYLWKHAKRCDSTNGE